MDPMAGRGATRPVRPGAGEQLDLLSYASPPPVAPATLPESLHFGAVGWRHPEWGDMVWSGTLSPADLALHGLAEYAEHPLFSTVLLVPGAEPFDEQTLRVWAAQLPVGFRCVVQAHRSVTAPRLTRSGGFDVRQSQTNPHFLDAAWFVSDVWRPAITTLNDHLGAVCLSFPPGLHAAGIPPAAFAERLEQFLARLPEHLPIAVELQEAEYLTLEYARALAGVGASHVFTTAPGMPPFAEQARWVPSGRQLIVHLGHPVGTQYASDVQRRSAVVDLLFGEPRREAFVLVDQSAEGSAPATIDGLIDAATDRLAGGHG